MCDDFIEFADILSNHPPPDNDVVYEFWRGDATCSCGNEMGLEAPFRYVVLACDECGRPVEFTCDEEIPNS